MLIFSLRKESYDKIRSGEKKIECREVKPYWTDRIFCEYPKGLRINAMRGLRSKGADGENCNIPCRLRLGYIKHFMTATITKIAMVDGKDTDLHIDKPVYAIHLVDVKEVKE